LEPNETTEKLEGPKVRQFSVFLENKVGALLDIVKLLNEHSVEVLALTVQDSTDSALARMIVSDPDRVADLLHRFELGHSVCEIFVVELSESTDLGKLLTALLMAEVNIHFCYPFLVRPRGRPILAMHVDDDECATAVLGSQGFRILTQSDISR
jgi:hypothetical protein